MNVCEATMLFLHVIHKIADCLFHLLSIWSDQVSIVLRARIRIPLVFDVIFYESPQQEVGHDENHEILQTQV